MFNSPLVLYSAPLWATSCMFIQLYDALHVCLSGCRMEKNKFIVVDWSDLFLILICVFLTLITIRNLNNFKNVFDCIVSYCIADNLTEDIKQWFVDFYKKLCRVGLSDRHKSSTDRVSFRLLLFCIMRYVLNIFPFCHYYNSISLFF